MNVLFTRLFRHWKLEWGKNTKIKKTLIKKTHTTKTKNKIDVSA